MTAIETLMRRWFDEVWNARRDEAIDELLAPHCLLHGLGPETMRGPDEFRPFRRAFLDAFPDVRIEVLSALSQGDEGFVRFRTTGTHTGDAMGPATGKPIAIEGVSHVRYEDGRVVEVWNLVDFLTMYRQLGWVSDSVGIS
jgi:steroid delta-isomerase-like uncharacterized protein